MNEYLKQGWEKLTQERSELVTVLESFEAQRARMAELDQALAALAPLVGEKPPAPFAGPARVSRTPGATWATPAAGTRRRPKPREGKCAGCKKAFTHLKLGRLPLLCPACKEKE